MKLEFEIAHLYGNCFLFKVGRKVSMIYLPLPMDND